MTAFSLGGGGMDYPRYTNESLTMMYEAVRGALVCDDSMERQGGKPKFKVRDTSDWKRHAADFETEMLSLGMIFDVIDWDNGQKKLLLD
jgi:hypothetical protein